LANCSTNKKDLYILGGGGLAREILFLVDLNQKWNFKGFVCLKEDKCIKETIISEDFFTNDVVAANESIDVVVGIGDPKIREKLFNKFCSYSNVNFPNLISPYSAIDPTAMLGQGVVISHHCFISSKAILGDFVFVNALTIVGHDSILKDYVSIMPGVSVAGQVIIGKKSFLGSNSFVLQGTTLGDDVMIGAGATVFHDVESGNRVYPPKSLELKF
jgi:sugar O-acyltransferase (sialic acid O-acetyltransferase NeuD family)